MRPEKFARTHPFTFSLLQPFEASLSLRSCATGSAAIHHGTIATLVVEMRVHDELCAAEGQPLSPPSQSRDATNTRLTLSRLPPSPAKVTWRVMRVHANQVNARQSALRMRRFNNQRWRVDIQYRHAAVAARAILL